MDLNVDAVQEHLRIAHAAKNPHIRARALENVAAELFALVPGCSVQRNIFEQCGPGEIDLVVGNDREPGGFPSLPEAFLIECKALNGLVDSGMIKKIIATMFLKSIRIGILFTTRGITGNPRDRNYAHSLGVAARAKNMTILVVTTKELGAIGSIEEFVKLINGCHLRAVGSGGIGFLADAGK